MNAEPKPRDDRLIFNQTGHKAFHCSQRKQLDGQPNITQTKLKPCNRSHKPNLFVFTKCHPSPWNTQSPTNTSQPLNAALDTVSEHIEGTYMYDFNLKHPRTAYIVGVTTYLDKMLEYNLKINRVEFETSLEDSLCDVLARRDGLPVPITIKLQCLHSSISHDVLLYNAFWAEQYEARGVVDPTLDTELGVLCTEATLFETRSALARYRANLRMAGSLALADEVDACISRYNEDLALGWIPVANGDEGDVGKDGWVWSENDEEEDEMANEMENVEKVDEMEDSPGDNEVDNEGEGDLIIAIANLRDPLREREWGRIIDMGDGWARWDTGDKAQWYCTLCTDGRCHNSLGSALRFLDIKHS